MAKIIKLFKNKDPYETCVICNSKTPIKKEQPIKDRPYYIAGVGQLCDNCYKNQ